jgi:hypothetical protein
MVCGHGCVSVSAYMYLCSLDPCDLMIHLQYMDGNTTVDAFGTVEIVLDFIVVCGLQL